MSVRTSFERKRGCGFRKPGGLYFIGLGRGRPCGLLPIPLESCPTCGHGIKFSRGWTWVNVAALSSIKTDGCKMQNCGDCPLADAKIEKAGLLWVGEKFYKTPEDWMREADTMGISRRIKAIPRGFELGKTWIALAHIKAIERNFRLDTPAPFPKEDSKEHWTPGIFRLFKPTAIEYVVKGTESEEELADMEKRGISLVKVVPVKDGLPTLMLEDTKEAA